jgi:hypothetical protein
MIDENGDPMLRTTTLALLVGLTVAACSSSSSDETTSTTTVVTTTTASATTTSAATSPSPVVPGSDADADAIVEVYAVVFDSSTSFDAKAPFITDPAGLESTVDAYTAAGDAVGGIFLEVTAVGIDGDEAAVIYDLLFDSSPFQPDQTGSAVRTDAAWQVTRAYFCSIMQLARVTCP